MQGFYRLEGEPIMYFKGMNTNFSFDVLKPETIQSATGFKILTEKHVTALAVKLSIEQEYQKMTDFFKAKYFPVYMLARIAYRIPVAGEELLTMHWDCLVKNKNTFFIKIGKRVRESDVYLNSGGKYNIPQYVPNLYSYFWYPASIDVAKCIVDYQVASKLPMDHFLFDWSLSGNNTEEKLKCFTDRVNQYINEFLAESTLGKEILAKYGMEKFVPFSMDKRYLLLTVWQIARENFFWLNAGKIDLNGKESLIYLQGPLLTDIGDDDPILYGRTITTTRKTLEGGAA